MNETDSKHWAGIREWAVALSFEAAKLAVKRLHNGMDITFKSDGSTVTDIDRAVESFLRERITAAFPTHAILGEEYGLQGDVSPETPLWAIDPIDGTANIAAGLPAWGVSVGLIAGGVPVVGALDFPLLDEVYAASRGGGGTLNGQPLPELGPGGDIGDEDAVGVCSSSVRSLALHRVPGKFRIFGSAALHVCYVAAGRMKAAQNIGTSLYDVAAGLCVAYETGAVAGWATGGEWSALDMVRKTHDPTDALICASPGTLDIVRDAYK